MADPAATVGVARLWSNERARAVGVWPGVVRIEHKGRALAGSSSLDTAPVTGSLLFYTPVALPRVVPLKSLCGCCSAVLTVAGLLYVDYIYGELV